MYTFRNSHSQQIVFLREIGASIQFAPEGHDEHRRALGVYRTADEQAAQGLRRCIAEGHIAAWEEDAEEAQAQQVISTRRAAAAARVAQAAASAA